MGTRLVLLLLCRDPGRWSSSQDHPSCPFHSCIYPPMECIFKTMDTEMNVASSKFGSSLFMFVTPIALLLLGKLSVICDVIQCINHRACWNCFHRGWLCFKQRSQYYFVNHPRSLLGSQIDWQVPFPPETEESPPPSPSSSHLLHQPPPHTPLRIFECYQYFEEAKLESYGVTLYIVNSFLMLQNLSFDSFFFLNEEIPCADSL